VFYWRSLEGMVVKITLDLVYKQLQKYRAQFLTIKNQENSTLFFWKEASFHRIFALAPRANKLNEED